MLVAVNRSYKKSDYIPCIAWGRNARFVKDIKVGQKLNISGRIQSREYVKKISETESISKTAYEVSINRISVDDTAEQVQSNQASFATQVSSRHRDVAFASDNHIEQD
jgi:single-stranded DNA-binding protein